MTFLRDIQDSAIDSESRLSDLLRKCKVLAHRLQHDELNQWVEYELNGYPSFDIIPDYRIVSGIAKGHFEAYGRMLQNMTIPSGSLPKEYRHWANEARLVQPISAIEETCSGSGDMLQIDWPGNLMAIVGQKIFKGYSMIGAWLEIPKSLVFAILDTVRNRILSFALEIEKENPDAGEAMPDDKPIPDEKVSQVFHTVINGNVQNVATGSTNVTQSGQFIVTKGDFESLSSFLKSKGISNEDIEELSIAVKEDEEHGQTQGFGKKVSGWMGKMLSKAGTEAWKVGTSSAGTLLTKALTTYLGLE